MNQASAEKKEKPQFFVSHSHVDDELPFDAQPKDRGLVTYVANSLAFELGQLGLPEMGVWLDKHKMRVGNETWEKISEELRRSDIFVAILSQNFLNSPWCLKELDVFIDELEADPKRSHRIFRVDKQRVANDVIPNHLQKVQAIPLYVADRETGQTDEFYRKGRPAKKKQMEAAIKKLADDIYHRINELKPPPAIKPASGEPIEGPWVRKPAPISEPETVPPVQAPPPPSRLRTVFVAKPASDLEDEYLTLVQELERRNIGVVPDPEQDIPDEEDAAVAFVHEALAKADMSIHVLGNRHGWKPEGSDRGIVPMQLTAARDASNLNSKFRRLIWAPKIVPGADDKEERDPFKVLAQFDGIGDSDDVFSDTAARFKDFVLQRVLAKPPPRPASESFYVAYGPSDKQYALEAAKAIKALGGKPTLGPFGNSFKGAQASDHIVCCWGSADEAEMLDALDAASEQLQARSKAGGKLYLLVCPPASEAKQDAIDIESFGRADVVIDAGHPLRAEALSALLSHGGS